MGRDLTNSSAGKSRSDTDVSLISRSRPASKWFLVSARDEQNIPEKSIELQQLGVPYTVVCGKDIKLENVVFRAPRGKYDAINFGFTLLPTSIEIVALNDVDTRIYGMDAAIDALHDSRVGLAFGAVRPEEGPQLIFYRMLDVLRKFIPVAASGELMLVRRTVLEKILPLQPCKAEDTYILFKVLELGMKAKFVTRCYVRTRRTSDKSGEFLYKRINVCGMYQALSLSKPPAIVRAFYFLLPLLSPILVCAGPVGYCWAKGIILGLVDYLRGDRSGFWTTAYMAA
jgi:hypothetical protein